MRPSSLPLLLCLATACGGDPKDTEAADTSTTTTTTTGAGTVTDTVTSPGTTPVTDSAPTTEPTLPAEHGFEFDGAWYPLVDGSTFCQPTGAYYTFSSGALRDGTGTQGNGYAYFGDVPTPGVYQLQPFDLMVSDLQPGRAAVGILDVRDSSFWFSDGVGGTLEVVDAGGGALDVLWHDVTLATASGATLTSAEGWMNCTP